MTMIRKARKPRTAKLVKKWTAANGTRYIIKQRPSGQYEANAISKDGADDNLALGSTPKLALAHLGVGEKYPAADRDPIWA